MANARMCGKCRIDVLKVSLTDETSLCTSILPAFIIAMLCLIVVSLATGEPSKEIQEEFEEVRAGK